MFFLLYKHTDDGVFADFPKISDHFLKISEEARRTFPNIFWEFPKIVKDFQVPEDVSMMHQQV